MPQPITLTIAGPANSHADLAGRMVASCANRLGWYVYGLPRQGGAIDDSDISLAISHAPIGCLNEKVDMLACFDVAAWERYTSTLNADAIVLADADIAITIPRRKKLRIIRLPIARLAREIGGNPRTRSSVAAAAIAALAGIPFIDLQPALELAIQPTEILGHLRAARVAHQAIQEQPGRLAMPAPSPHHASQLMTGAQAAALGIIAGGATFVAAAESNGLVVSDLCQYKNNLPLVLQKTSDLQQAAAQAMGAAIAGTRALSISDQSIGELANGLRAAAISETPLVFLHCAHANGHVSSDQQALQTALNLGGDVPHVVMSPADNEEVFSLMQESFNIAENLQTPVVILCDGQLLQAIQSTPDLTSVKTPIQRGQLLSAKQARSVPAYMRYQLTANGISSRKVPGQPGDVFVTSTLNHSVSGFTGSIADHINQTEKRLRKTDHLLESGLPYKVHGPMDADVTLICFGSCTGAAVRASQLLNSQEVVTNVLQIVSLAPFPAEQIHRIFRGSKHLLLIEADTTAQLAKLIRQQTGIGLHHQLLISGDATISMEQIVRIVKRKFTHG